jgi:CHAT domain-containing protein
MFRRLRLLAALLPLTLQQAGRDDTTRGEAVPAAGPAAAPAPQAPVAQVPVAQAPTHPRAIVWSAVLAMEGDSADVARARWEERLRHDARDREAQLGLATLDRLAARHADAARRYRAILDARPVRLDAIAVYARAGLAALAQARGAQRVAEGEYTRAAQMARAAGEVPAEVQARLGVARARARLYGPVSALAVLDSIAPLLPPSDLRLRATYAAGRAAILAQLGRPEAREVALECVDLARRANAQRAEVACYQPLAMDGERRGDTRPAIALLEQVAEHNRRAGDRWALANTLQWQGYLLTTRGEYGVARTALQAAVEHAEAADNGTALAWASLRLAQIARYVQDRPTAAALAARSAAAFQQQGDTAGTLEARELEARLAADAGDFARAARLTNEQLAWARRARQPRLEMSALIAQAAVAERRRDWPAALALLDDADSVMQRNGMDGWADMLWYQRGRIALRQGDLVVAEPILKRALEVLDPVQHVFRYRTRARLAGVYARRGELARAERELATADDELDAWRRSLTDEQLRVAAYQAVEDEDTDLGVPKVIAALAAASQVKSAFALAEGRRARTLASRLAQVAAMRAMYAPGDSASVQSLSTSFAPFATATAVANTLPDERTALLEYVTGGDGAPTTLLVIRRQGGRRVMRAVLLPPADLLAPRIARLVALLEAGGDPAALARTLGAMLVDPALPHLGPGVTNLVVVPDGPVHRVPFDALVLADGRHVVERFAVSSAPSAAIAAALWRRPRTPVTADAPVRVLAFGDPSFASESTAPWSPGATPALLASRGASRTVAADPAPAEPLGTLPRLAESGREARLVAAYAPGSVVRLREEASEAYLKTAPLADFRVIHFATHALVDESSVARTALALAPGGGESGFLTPGDLATLPLHADLVVLSACRTASGVLVTGEGVQGLTGPLLAAGARAVVATGWRIDDRRTVAFVARFYDALADGLPVAAALRAAKLDAIRRGVAPSEWAAFTLVGDATVTIPHRHPPPSRGGWAAAGALVAVVVGGLLVLTRRVRTAER